MEASCIKRLTLLTERVREHMRVCSELSKCKDSTNAEHSTSLELKLNKLKLSVDRMISEVQSIIQNERFSDNAELAQLINAATEVQLEAEDIIVDLSAAESTKQGNQQPICPTATQTTSRLPKLEMTKFSGDILKWTEFWDQFTSTIDQRKDLLTNFPTSSALLKVQLIRL